MVSSLAHLTLEERSIVELVNQIGAGPAIVIGDAAAPGGLSRDFIASLHPHVLLAAYRAAGAGQLHDRIVEALLNCTDPTLDWYDVLRELCRPNQSAIIINGHDEGEMPEPREDKRRATVYDRLDLPADVRHDWETLLNGRTGENPGAVVGRLAGAVADSCAGMALLLSQLNGGRSSPAWATLRNLVTHQASGADPIETLLGIYAHHPWPDSSPLLVEAIGHCCSRVQLKRVVATGAGSPTVVAAAAERWVHLPEQLPTNVRTNPATPKT